MGGASSGVEFNWKPDVTEVIYLHEMVFQMYMASITDGTKFAAMASALTNGLYTEIVNKDGSTQVLKLTPTIYNNSQLSQLGFSAGTIGLNVVYNLQDAFGGEVPINGYVGEYVRIKTQDALTSVNNIYVHLRGHYKDEK